MIAHRHYLQTGPRTYQCTRCPFAFTLRPGQHAWPIQQAHAFPRTEETP